MLRRGGFARLGTTLPLCCGVVAGRGWWGWDPCEFSSGLIDNFNYKQAYIIFNY